MAPSALNSLSHADQKSPESQVTAQATSSGPIQSDRTRYASSNTYHFDACPTELDLVIMNAHPDRLRNALRKMAESRKLVLAVEDHLDFGKCDNAEKEETYAAYKQRFYSPPRLDIAEKYDGPAVVDQLQNRRSPAETKGTTSPAKKSRKRKSSNHVVCAHCDEVFDTEDNDDDEACTYHDGMMEPDEDAFVDWDERCHGDIHSTEIKEAYPENYIWDCCDAAGDEEGCETGVHVEREGHKRSRG